MILHFIPNEIRDEEITVLLVQRKSIKVVVSGGLNQGFSVGFRSSSVKRNPQGPKYLKL